MNYRNVLNKGTSILKKFSIPSAQIDAELLLSLALKKNRERIILNLEENLNTFQAKNYFQLIERRKKREPISIILGKKFFWKEEYLVNRNVLTPRFETELLIEQLLKIYKNSERKSVLDIGTGSGCFLISLLKDKNNWLGTGIDISKIALKIAKINAKIQQVDNRITFIHSDVDKYSGRKYDLIVSNPPYINKIEYSNLDIGVKGYEPKKALYGGIDGLKVIEKVIKKNKIFLKNNGLLAMEIGCGQHYKVIKKLMNNGFYVIDEIKDYQNIKRFLLAKKIK